MFSLYLCWTHPKPILSKVLKQTLFWRILSCVIHYLRAKHHRATVAQVLYCWVTYSLSHPSSPNTILPCLHWWVGLLLLVCKWWTVLPKDQIHSVESTFSGLTHRNVCLMWGIEVLWQNVESLWGDRERGSFIASQITSQYKVSVGINVSFQWKVQHKNIFEMF